MIQRTPDAIPFERSPHSHPLQSVPHLQQRGAVFEGWWAGTAGGQAGCLVESVAKLAPTYQRLTIIAARKRNFQLV